MKKAILLLEDGFMLEGESFGAEGGPLYLETRSALYDAENRPPIINYIYGLGGSDVRLDLMRQVYSDLSDLADGVEMPGRLVYLGAR